MPARRQFATTYDEHGAPEPPRPRGRDGREKESFDCDFPGCGQTYSRMEYLKRHQRKHQDDRPFQCRDCNKAFARSDVLLRHRRRCHPTPPPTERNTNSPPPAAVRNYPGVPVSSSRTDARNGSPSRSRKRRNSGTDGVANGHSQQRRRLDDEDGFEDDGDEFGEHAASNGRYRHDGLNDLYSMNNNNYYADVGESSQYTPHLIPVFQQSGAFPEPRDPNHLEDASVLLSFAYPGGVPPNESADGNNATARPTAATSSGAGMTVQGQQVVPDWEGGQTIDMMMEHATTSAADGTTGSAARNNSIGSAGTGGGSLVDDSSAGAQATLAAGDPIGNFLGTLSWLSAASAGSAAGTVGGTAQKDGASAGEGVNMNWTLSPRLGAGAALGPGLGQSPRPLSPWALSSLFSPSLLNMTLPQTVASPGGGGSDTENTQQQANLQQHAMTILEQLAMFDMPQTRTNPNPERPLIRIDQAHVAAQQGLEIDPSSPFFVDAERFATCYRVPHWRMPSVRVLSTIACRTFHTVLNHLSFVHVPTFRLVDTAGCLAFAICTVGGVRANTIKWDVALESYAPSTDDERPDSLDGPVPPGGTWESMYQKNYKLGSKTDAGVRDEENAAVGQWRSGPVVRNEKTNMLIKSFSAAKGVLMTEYNVALLQALILYHAPYYLSQDEHERQMANMYLGTIVNISRQIGLFNQELDHMEPEIAIPDELHTPNELNMCWRRWIQLETRRRTAFLVYHLDTVSALESNIPCILSSCELGYLPVPAPDTLWKAKNPDEWYAAVKKYRPMTLDEAMRRTFFLPTFGAFDSLHENADTKFYNLLNESEYGPFARTAMILTLLRGVMDIGEGKRDRGDWRDLTDLWVSCTWLRPQNKMLSSDGKDLGRVTRESLKERFTLALQRWREGWDFDSLCLGGSAASPASSTSPGSSSHTSPTSDSAQPSQPLNYCEEALPYYWLAQALLNMLKAAPPYEPGYNVFANVKYGEMLKSARMFTRLGEGVPTAPSCSTSSHSTTDTPASAQTSFATSVGQANASAPQSGLGTTPGIPEPAIVRTPDFGFLSDLMPGFSAQGPAVPDGTGTGKSFDAAAAVAALSGPGDLTAGLEVLDPGMLQGLNYNGLDVNF